MANQRTDFDVFISANCIKRMNEMEKIFGAHYPQHDEIRERYKNFIKSATYVERTEDGGIILYFKSADEWKEARETKFWWWSDVISWSVGND